MAVSRLDQLREELREAFSDQAAQNDPDDDNALDMWITDAHNSPVHPFQKAASEYLALCQQRDDDYNADDFARDYPNGEPERIPSAACAHEWHYFGLVNGQPDVGCQKCGATRQQHT